MRYIFSIILVWLSVTCYGQTTSATISDANGNLVGTVSSYTNYVGNTTTTLYDGNGHLLGSVDGNNYGGLLGANFAGSHTIVSGSNTSTVVLGSGTQALDYYLGTKGSSSGKYPILSEEYLTDYAEKYWEKYPEYYWVPVIDHDKIHNKIKRLRKQKKPEDYIFRVKLDLIEKYMLKNGEHPNNVIIAHELANDKYLVEVEETKRLTGIE